MYRARAVSQIQFQKKCRAVYRAIRRIDGPGSFVATFYSENCSATKSTKTSLPWAAAWQATRISSRSLTMIESKHDNLQLSLVGSKLFYLPSTKFYLVLFCIDKQKYFGTFISGNHLGSPNDLRVRFTRFTPVSFFATHDKTET